MIDLEEDLFQIASYLTEPICKVREYIYRGEVVESSHPTDSKIKNLARICFCYLAAFSFAFLALFTTIPGILIRGATSYFQAEPFIALKGEGKTLEGRKFSLLSWNLCCVPGGYSISDGGVSPWQDRIDLIVQKIISVDADVNCFYEMFDAKSHIALKKALKEAGYTHFYTNIGPRTIGAASGIMVASKFEMQNPEFTPFPESTLVGRTKWATKGVFGFDLVSENTPFARIYATHLQHSEIPEFKPEFGDEEEILRRNQEVLGRKEEIQMIFQKALQGTNICTVVTGDLNMDDDELISLGGEDLFEKGDRFDGKTWLGDAFCAKLMDKRVSGPLNLDHTLVLKGTLQKIETILVPTNYCPSHYHPEALSDHEGLYSQISL